MKNFFEACRTGELDLVKEYIQNGSELNEYSTHGFTPLHYAAMGSNETKAEINIEILKVLVDAGADVNEISKDGRSILFLLAEFSPLLEAVQFLIEKGANPEFRDSNGNHIVENAMMPEIQEYLSQLTGFPIPIKQDSIPSIKMSPELLKKAKESLKIVFEKLENNGLITKQNAGQTQSDGFDDCVELFNRSKNKNEIIGFCFYSKQDFNRAKRTSILPLSFWASPDGNDENMIKVGNIIVKIIEENELKVVWNGHSSQRPLILFHS